MATSGGAGRTKRWGGRDAASSSKPMWRVSYEWRDLGAKLGGSDPRGLLEEMVGEGVEEAFGEVLGALVSTTTKRERVKGEDCSGTKAPRSGDQRDAKIPCDGRR